LKNIFPLIMLMLVIGNCFGQERFYSGDIQKDVRATKVKTPEGIRIYYSWDIGFAYLTGLDLPKAKKAWLTAAHLFSNRKSVRLDYINKQGRPESWYLNQVKYVGNDICQFIMGQDTSAIKLELPWHGGGEIDRSPLDFLPVEVPLTAYGLLDGKRHEVFALFAMMSPLGEIRGLAIARETKLGDCGSGFIIGEDKKLFITIRSLPTNQEQLDQFQAQLAGISCCALAVAVSFHRNIK